METILEANQPVRLKDQGEEVFVVENHEMHNEMVFYNLNRIGGLFLRSSLELA